MKFKKLITGIALSSLMALGVGVGLASKGEVKEAKAATDETLIYVDVSASHWATSWKAASDSYKIKLWNGSEGTGEAWAWDHELPVAEGGVGEIVVSEKTYFYFSREFYLPANYTGGYVYAYNTDSPQNKSATFAFADATSGQNLLVVSGGTDSAGPSIAWSTLELGIQHTITKYAVRDGVLDDEHPLGTVDVVEGDKFATPDAHYEAYYTFGGWFKEAACTNAWDPDATISADTSIYAKLTPRAAVEGTIAVDLKNSGWGDEAANYSVYLWNDTEGLNAWTAYTALTVGKTLVSFNYSVGFTPDKLIVVRYASDVTEEAWAANRWDTKDAQTVNTDFHSMVTVLATETAGKKNTDYGCASVIGKTNGVAEWDSLHIDLGSVKLNVNNHAEYYSTSVTLAAENEFKVVHAGGYYNTFTIHESIAANFYCEGDSEDNVEVITGGTYAFYFDSKTGSFYITTEALAAADDWAQEFLADVVCDGEGHITSSHWSDLATSYAALSEDAKALFLAVAAGGDKDGNFVEAAVARYDYILVKYGTTAYADFMSRKSINGAKAVASNPLSAPTANNNNVIIIVVVASAAALLGASLFFILRKRRVNK